MAKTKRDRSTGYPSKERLAAALDAYEVADAQRAYYQDLCYKIAALLNPGGDPNNTVMVGTVDSPSVALVEAVLKLCRPSVRSDRQYALISVGRYVVDGHLIEFVSELDEMIERMIAEVAPATPERRDILEKSIREWAADITRRSGDILWVPSTNFNIIPDQQRGHIRPEALVIARTDLLIVQVDCPEQISRLEIIQRTFDDSIIKKLISKRDRSES